VEIPGSKVSEEIPNGNSGYNSQQSSVFKDYKSNYQRQFREPSGTQTKRRGGAKSVDFGHKSVSVM